jgi:hypothetical protein
MVAHISRLAVTITFRRISWAASAHPESLPMGNTQHLRQAVGRLLIATFLHESSPFPYILVNSLIRVSVLMFIAFLAIRAARQTKELQERVDSLVTICAWSRTVEYQGEWISFEEYLLRRFNVNTNHGMSPAEKEKILTKLEGDGGPGIRTQNEAQHGG